MNANEEQQNFYKKLKENLNSVQKFPGEYVYKFIIPTNNKTIAEIQRVFDGTNPIITTRESKNAKYTSLTVAIYALDADQVIRYYKGVGQIKDVIML